MYRIFSELVKYKTLLCIVDYYSNFPFVKKVAGLSVDDLVYAIQITFAEFRLCIKITSDVETNLLQKHSGSSAKG